MLDSEKSTATLYEIQALREGINDLREQNQRRAAREDMDRHNRRLAEIKEKIQPPDYRLDQLVSTDARHGWSFGQWLLNHDSFKAWYDRGSPDSRVLFVHGKPGTGE